RPFENNNQWAASFGGPIKKDRAFFFLNTEGLRYTFGSSNEVFVPTQGFQSYVLGTSLPANNPASVPFYQQLFALYNSAPGVASAAAVVSSCGPDLGTTVAGGECLASYRVSVPNGNREWLLSGRVDYNFSDHDKVFGRVKFDRGNQPTYTDPINPVFNIQSNQPQDEGQLNYTHVFSPRVVNNFIGSGVYYSGLFESPNLGKALFAFPYLLNITGAHLTPPGFWTGYLTFFACISYGLH